MLWASASVKYLKDKIKHPDSIIDKTLRKSWILILPDL
jgi:ppGpp synthetase/RelA/SpoT-type nucleotidyltranferase